MLAAGSHASRFGFLADGGAQPVQTLVMGYVPESDAVGSGSQDFIVSSISVAGQSEQAKRSG